MELRNNFLSAILCFFCVLITGVKGEEIVSDLESGLVVAGVGCVVVLIIALAICIDKRVHSELLDKGPPFWTRCLAFKPEYSGGLTAVSDGMDNMSQYQVVRRRLGRAITDGARWDVGFTEGKHVFEVQWPVQCRGSHSSVGIGCLDAPLKKQGRLTLVGNHSSSWGLDLSSRKAVNSGKPVGGFARQIEDRFYMYIDLDGGKIGFGEDVKTFGQEALFFGWVINNIRLNRSMPLHPMVGMTRPQEQVYLFYVGTAVPAGGFDLCPPPPPPQVEVAQGQMYPQLSQVAQVPQEQKGPE